jgi:hypothetical protein
MMIDANQPAFENRKHTFNAVCRHIIAGKLTSAVIDGIVREKQATNIAIGAMLKHLGRYIDEFALRLNDGNVTRHTTERPNSFVDGVAGKRLTYKALIQ